MVLNELSHFWYVYTAILNCFQNFSSCCFQRQCFDMRINRPMERRFLHERSIHQTSDFTNVFMTFWSKVNTLVTSHLATTEPDNCILFNYKLKSPSFKKSEMLQPFRSGITPAWELYKSDNQMVTRCRFSTAAHLWTEACWLEESSVFSSPGRLFWLLWQVLFKQTTVAEVGVKSRVGPITQCFVSVSSEMERLGLFKPNSDQIQSLQCSVLDRPHKSFKT